MNIKVNVKIWFNKVLPAVMLAVENLMVYGKAIGHMIVGFVTLAHTSTTPTFSGTW